MPKKIKHESFKYAFLNQCSSSKRVNTLDKNIFWEDFLNILQFNYLKNSVQIKWNEPKPGEILFSLSNVSFYKRKNPNNINKKSAEKKNQEFFKLAVDQLASKAYFINLSENNITKNKERIFHNEWSKNEDPYKINVIKINEVCTAPEIRYIVKKLGNLNEKTLLDLGCGLGEASVYFAIKGAKVTSSDISSGMLSFTKKLAIINNTNVSTHLADAEKVGLNIKNKYDIIYAGNLLHHIEIKSFLKNIVPQINSGGIFISWDPLAYNPIINIYRFFATEVRTPDEHPFRIKDIKIFNQYFHKVEKKYFWFFTLIIFVIMALIQRRNPNKERFWKVILEEGNKWAWIYKPLEKLDKIILFLCPPLRLLCWNIVIFAYKK